LTIPQHKCVGFTLFGEPRVFIWQAAHFAAQRTMARVLAPRRGPSLFEQLLKQDFEIQNVFVRGITPWMNRL
jgi:hypothetical protein